MHWGGGNEGRATHVDKRRKPVNAGNGWGVSKGAWGCWETEWEDADQTRMNA